MASALYPHVKVRLSGQDGNAFAVLGVVRSALEQAGESDGAAQFMTEATTGDYEHLIATAMRFVQQQLFASSSRRGAARSSDERCPIKDCKLYW